MTKKKNNEVATLEAVTIPDKEQLRANLKKLIKEIEDKLQKLGASSENTPPAWKCLNLGFKYEEASVSGVSLHQATNLEWLIKCLMKMKNLKADYLKEVEQLEISPVPVLTWNGVAVDSWINDFEIRIKQVANAKAIKDLTDSKTKLESFLSEDDRLIKTLGDVSNLLGIKQNLLT